MRRAALAAALAVTTAFHVQALSKPLTLAEQARKAQVIVRAVVGQSKPVTEGDVTYTVYPLEVKETVAGDVASLPQLDGKPALYLLQGLVDTPKISAGQEAFLLLYIGKMDSPVVGVNQGVYVLQSGKVTAGELTDPDKLRDAIRAAKEGK